MLNDSGHIKKQGSLRFTSKSMQPAKAIFFTNTSKTKGLTGKTCQEYIVLGYFMGINFRDIACDVMIGMIVCLVSYLCVLIPFTGKYTLTANTIKRLAKTADACE